MAHSIAALDTKAWQLPASERDRYFSLKREMEADRKTADDIAIVLEGFLWNFYETADDDD